MTSAAVTAATGEKRSLSVTGPVIVDSAMRFDQLGSKLVNVTDISRKARVRSVTRVGWSTDARYIDRLLSLHAVANPRILDASYGRGRMWRGLRYSPVRLDIRPELDLDVVGDWNAMADLFGPSRFDVVVWDPPHITDAGDGIVGERQWADRYGTRTSNLRADSISHLYAPFLEAAAAVLVPNSGIVLAKIADQVHCGAQQWQHVDFIRAGSNAGYTPCDYDLKQRAGGIDDPKWTHRYHVRKPWSFWIVLRNGSNCRGPGASLVRHCAICGSAFKPTRADARACSDRCRQRRRRSRLQEHG